VLVIAPVLCGICDNPRASELTNHMGWSANRYCRMCYSKFMHEGHVQNSKLMMAPVGVGMCDCGIKLICNLNIRCDSHVTVRVSHMTVHVQGM